MPNKELSNSLKAKLYDYTFTPFMSSVVISWLIVNHKYVLILLSNSKLDKKLELLNKYDFSCAVPFTDYSFANCKSFILPIMFGLFYTLFYPFIAILFYKVTLRFKKIMKENKIKIEGLTPLTLEESKIIKEENIKYKNEVFNLSEKIVSIEEKYKKEITFLEDRYKNMKDEFLMTKEHEYKTKIEKLEKEVESLNKKNSILKEKIEKNKINPKSDKEKVLLYLYNLNYNNGEKYKNQFISDMVVNTKLKRAVVEDIFNELTKEEIITFNKYDKVSITENGYKILKDKFYK